MTGISGLVFSAERNRLEARIHLQTIGLLNPKIHDSIRPPEELNFSTLVNMYSTITEIKSLICSSVTNIELHRLTKPIEIPSQI